MRITFHLPVVFISEETDEPVEIPVTEKLSIECELKIADYFDRELVDAGIIGGEIAISANETEHFLTVTYWSPSSLSDKLLKKLQDETIVQFTDGMGENGFEVTPGHLQVIAMFDEEGAVQWEEYDDGREVAEPSAIAIAARDGKFDDLKRAYAVNPEGIDARLQGYTGLHLAILYGHLEEALFLAGHGADPNLGDPEGKTALQICGLSNGLDDEQSCVLAETLLKAGADPNLINPGTEPAKEYASIRKKAKLEEMLG
jgi:hypothetical protein